MMPMLTRVSVRKLPSIIREFHLFAPRQGTLAGLTLTKTVEIAQISFTVRPCDVGGEAVGKMHFEHILQKSPAVSLHMFPTADRIVVRLKLSFTRMQGRQISNRLPYGHGLLERPATSPPSSLVLRLAAVDPPFGIGMSLRHEDSGREYRPV